MKLNVLGEIHLSTGDHPVRLGTGKERELFVHLALANGAALPAPELADRLWDGSPPSAFRTTLHTYVTRLRRRLRSAGVNRPVLSHNGGGYVLHLPRQDSDWGRLLHLRSRASALRETGQHQAARTTLSEALELWRGTPLAGFPGRWAERMRVTMERAHQATLEEWAKLSLDAGDAASVLQALDDALSRYPTHEPLHLCALRAMSALGRTSDALVAYQVLKNRLSEELGTSPTTELQREFHRLLHESSPISHKSEDSPSATSPPPLDNLDRDTKYFRGRESELLVLSARLREPDPESPRIWIISGMPGIGKSTLAMHAAHRVKGDFPDARLHLDLRGNHEQLPPLTSSEAVTELLRLLRVPAKHIPDALPEQIALWREHTRSLRALLILDDAATAEQVAPLLSVGDRCAILVTSRSQLPEMDEVERLPLGLPSLAESVEMFAAASQSPTWEDETPGLMEEVIARCGRLPLAVRLTATLMRLSPTWTLEDVLRRLPQMAQHGLSAFRVGRRDMATVFDLSLRAVSAQAREAFLLLGLHPTRIMCAAVATALIGRDEDSSRRALDELVRASLIEEHEPHRFRIHTLLKSHAFRRAQESLPEEVISDARERMHRAYLESCRSADLGLHPHRQGCDSEDLSQGVEPWEPERADSWLRRELPTVLTVIGDAQAHGPGQVAADLAHAVAEHLDVHGPWHSAPALHEYALQWYEQEEDARGMARASFDLARALWRTNQSAQAMWHNAAAREYWARVEDTLGEAWGVAQLGTIHFVSGRYDRSLVCLGQVLKTFERRRHRPGLVFALHFRGLCHYMTGSFPESISDFSDAISILEDSPDPDNLLDTRMNLAGALQQLGFHREAWTLCEQVLDTAQRRGDDRRSAVAWSNQAELALHRHHPEQAIDCLTHALTCLERFHDPWTESSVLTTMGTALTMFDRFEEARASFQRSLSLREFAPPTVLVDAFLGLAQVEQATGNTAGATLHLRHAIETSTHHGLRKQRAEAHHALGRHLCDLGDQALGRDHLEQAAFHYDELGAPEAEIVHSLLEHTDSKPTTRFSHGSPT